ncbi:Rhodanese-related sulfurtransferase [Formosa sp. Hel1_31_208]|nr:rhodanese-like domain-containing protein [Formosa sp. Hel1_31_208]SDR87962.1 Rhodanese-related sulfurtransferase [Formosa sp. Hel1_31_208]
MKTKFLLLFSLTTSICFSQNSMRELLKKYNTGDIPYISVEELAMPKTKAIILDARELAEFEISHLKNAIHIGYDEFQMASIENVIQNKNNEIIVYCSLGIRSEVIAKRLREEGYTNVKNLFGGIFEWKNKNFKVYNSQDKLTDSIHAYSKSWSKWLEKGIKVYPNELVTDD